MHSFALRTLAAVLSAGLLALTPSGPAGAQSAARSSAPASETRTPLPAPGKEIEYAARPGDTMIGIARRLLIDGKQYDVQRAFWEHNQLKDKDAIAPGQVIRIPENWIRNEAGRIELAHVEGEVISKGQPLKPGAQIGPGDDFRTGKNGYVTIKLADGSTLALQPGSDLTIEEVRKTPLATAASAKFLLKTGRVEAAVQKRSATGARFEVRTPIAVAAVRGTRFRVTANSEKRTATSEVLEGVVQVDDAGNLGSVSVPDGFGTRVVEGSAPAAPRALLAAPRLWTGIRLWIRRPVRLNFTKLPGAVNYRILVARRADFGDVVGEYVLPDNVIQLPQLENGPYFIKVRGIDDLGLEGRDTAADLVLNLPAAPAPNAPGTTGTPAAPATPSAPNPTVAPAAPPAPQSPATKSP